MVLPRNTSYVTFGLILLGAILVLVSGVFLAREEIRVPVEQNQLPLTRFTATLLEEIESLDSLYLNHLQDLNELIGPNSTRIEIASFCREVVGIEQATLLEEGEPPRHLDLRTEGRDESLPLPHRLGDGVEYDGLLVDTKPLEGFNPLPNYYITGSPDDRLYFVGKCFYNTILVLRLDPEAIRISGLAWMKQWSSSAILPLQESGLQVEVRAPGDETVASSLVNREKAAPDFLLPIPSRVGDWQLAAWNETRVITSYHLPVLIGSAALFVVVALAGFLGFGQQLKAIRVAEQRVSFANRVSHELRTPMTNILLNTDLLSDAIPVEEASSRRRLDLVREDKLVSEVRQKAQANVSFTKAMVALAPL
ncbi:MAG: histidine kinase dimerization/phospho-acceptor domain-containing protein, partial [Verrucomicrobiota bacterium]